MLSNKSSRRRFQILSDKVSDEQKDNLSELKETIAASVDNPPTQETIQAIITEIKEIASDGIITDEEKAKIATGIQERIASLGVTESEAQDIISAVKKVIAESPLPQLFETYQGTPKKDFLLGFRDNILVGSSGDGQEEEDILMEGLGQKQFIFNTNFDNDGLFRNDGIRFSDVPFVRNLNIADGAVQLNGSADDYTLGNLGEISDSLQGKFANLVGSEINYIEPGLPLV